MHAGKLMLLYIGIYICICTQTHIDIHTHMYMDILIWTIAESAQSFYLLKCLIVSVRGDTLEKT